MLARNFAAERPDQVWLADISYLPTDEGWLYLAAIKDLATREILGWSMAEHLRAELCRDALVMALQRHGRPPRGLVHHSDRGVQYASEPYRAVLERHGITQSMSCKSRYSICRTLSDRSERAALASLPRRRSAALKPGACGAPLRGCGA